MSSFFTDVKREISEGRSSLTGVKDTIAGDEQQKKVSTEAKIEESYRRLEEFNQRLNLARFHTEITKDIFFNVFLC